MRFSILHMNTLTLIKKLKLILCVIVIKNILVTNH